MTEKTPIHSYHRAHRVPWRTVEEKAVLISVENSEVMVLNEVGSYIWDFLNEGKTLSQITEHVSEAFDSDEENIEQEVLSFLDDMKDRGAVDVREN